MLKKSLFLVLAVLVFHPYGFSQKTETPEQKVMHERVVKNAEFANPEESPLEADDIPGFKTLNYYPYNSEYCISALLKRNPEPLVFKMKTTTERRPEYRTYGELQFRLKEKEYTLQVYQRVDPIAKPGYDKYLFLPFTDETSGRETYGGGRFLDIFIPEKGDTVLLDFNGCYNPYCAYNHKYSCPIPPEENDLPVKVEAGELPYQGDR